MIGYTLTQTLAALKKRYTLFYICGIVVLCLLANIAMLAFRTIYGMNDGSFGYNLIVFAEGVFVIPYYSCIFLSDIIFGKEYPNPYIRDKYTVGLHRWQIYIGKLIASILMGAVLFFIAFGVLILTTMLFCMNDGTIDTWVVLDFLEKASVALPLWIAGLSIGQMFLFAFDDKKKSFIGFYVLVLLIPRAIMLLASEKIHFAPCVWLSGILLTPQFNALQFFFTMDRGKAIITGLIYTVISTALGITLFYRKKF